MEGKVEMEDVRNVPLTELAVAYRRLLAKRQYDKDRYPTIKDKKKEYLKARYRQKKEEAAEANKDPNQTNNGQ